MFLPIAGIIAAGLGYLAVRKKTFRLQAGLPYLLTSELTPIVPEEHFTAWQKSIGESLPGSKDIVLRNAPNNSGLAQTTVFFRLAPTTDLSLESGQLLVPFGDGANLKLVSVSEFG
jgi:hypothetical protein